MSANETPKLKELSDDLELTIRVADDLPPVSEARAVEVGQAELDNAHPSTVEAQPETNHPKEGDSSEKTETLKKNVLGTEHNLSEEELRKIAMHPDADEADWLNAIEKLSQKPPATKAEPPKKQKMALLAISLTIGLLALAAIGNSVNPQGFAYLLNSKPAVTHSKKWNDPNYANRRAEVEKLSSIISNPSSETSDIASAYQNRAIDYWKLGDYELSVSDSTKAMEMSPERPGPLYNRAGANAERAYFKSAIRDYTTLIKEFPENSDYFCRRGKVYWQMGDYLLAHKDFETSIKIDPSNDMAFAGQAWTYHHQNKLNEALSAINEAIRLKPTGIFIQDYNDIKNMIIKESHE